LPSAAYSGTVGNYYYSPTVYEAYSPVLEARTGVFMTTINSPGLYGNVFASVPSLTYNVRPSASNFYTARPTEVLAPRTVTITPTMRATVTPEPAAVPENTARVNVMLPSDADLFIQGVRMTEQGSYREFVSPPLIPGEDYTYDIRARWNENGRDVVRSEVVRVRAGQRTDVDLMRAPEAPATPTLRTRPTVPEAPAALPPRTEPSGDVPTPPLRSRSRP
jgi:uncharacterized protein (TIGR03000 family)